MIRSTLPASLTRRRSLAALLAVMTWVAAGCVLVDEADGPEEIDAGIAVDDGPVDDEAAVADELTASDDTPPVGELEMLAIAADLDEFWVDAADQLGVEYDAVPVDRITFADDGVTCDGRPIPEDEVDGNAFVDSGCAEGLLVALDREYVGASTARAEATLAHEWGHVVQFQATDLDLSLDPDGLPIDAELQADCFAGAWAAEGATAPLTVLRDDVAASGDPDEVDIESDDAHGTPEQRVAAFDVGTEGGVEACIDELIDALP